MKACVFTLGCKMNEVESASLMQGLKERGYEVFSHPCYADLYILNTCAVTREAERKSRQAVTRLRRYNPEAKIIVCGCASQHAPARFRLQGVKLVSGTANKGRLLNMLDESGVLPPVSEEAFCDMPPPVRVGTRAFLRIQDGCNRFCSYCLIPYLRGRSRSRSIESIVREAAASDAKEIVLTGIDVSSYKDGDNDLCALLTALKDHPARFRLGSLEVSAVTDELLLTMKRTGNVCPHFHLSLQSGSSSVLRAMNRRYSRGEYLSACAKIYAAFPDAAVTTDIIVGFPTETERDFLDSLSIIGEAGFARVHAFPFSPREGTNAEKLPDLPSETKRERMKRITEAAEAAQKKYLEKQIGKTLLVLFEDDGGYSENYVRVYADSAEEGSLKKVRIVRPFRDGLWGEIIKS